MKKCKYCGTIENLVKVKNRYGSYSIWNCCNKCNSKNRSEKQRGKKLSEETKYKIGCYQRGNSYEKLYGKKKAKEIKLKQSNKAKNRKHSNETKLKLSILRKELYKKGLKHPMLGKRYSEKYKKQMNQEKKITFLGKNNPAYTDGIGSYEKYKKDYCEICNNNKKRLLIHHKDKNRHNNNINNLQTLCYSCHMKVHKNE